ncbi:unnamed protein product [Ectocarpus sp. CCAP 1310/34]|nr:unnamed protein product [Ectocarpus sp. CCAP 1310/34]
MKEYAERPSRLILSSPEPSVIIPHPVFSKGRNRYCSSLSISPVACATQLVSNTRRSEHVSALASHFCRLYPLSSHLSSCTPTATFSRRP